MLKHNFNVSDYMMTSSLNRRKVATSILLLRVESANFSKLKAPALEVGCAWQAVSWLHSDTV